VSTKTKFTELAEGETTDDVYYQLISGAYTKTSPTADGVDPNAYVSTTKKYKMTTTTNLVTKDSTGENVVGTVDSSSGVVYFIGLGAGTYILKETKTPDGYNTMDPIEFTIKFDSDTKAFSTTHRSVQFNSTDGLFHDIVLNYAGSALPHTGGIGTTIFYVVGSVLVLGACIALITRRRMNKATK
jgi:LPXTG-motif cell wall-anchored protein